MTTDNIRISILVFSGTSMMTLAAVMDPLRAANRLSRKQWFKWQLLSPQGAPLELSSGVKIDADGKLDDSVKGDVLIVVAGFNQDREAPASLIPTITRCARRFRTIFSIEAGAWVLARAGLLKGHTVTTHWEDLENFEFAYPQLQVADQRYVVDGNIWSAGGASPAMDMMLHYLRTNISQSLALDVANVFNYAETMGGNQEATPLFINRLNRMEPRLAAALRLMESNLESPLSIPEIAQGVRLSMRNLELLTRRHLGTSPGAYYLRTRLQAARRLVLDTNTSMLDISVRTGFASPSSFSRAFKNRFQVSPLQMRSLETGAKI